MADVCLHGCRLLAAAVLKQAVMDTRSAHPVTCSQAKAWLVAPTSAADRSLWCALLKLDDGALARRVGYLDEDD